MILENRSSLLQICYELFQQRYEFIWTYLKVLDNRINLADLISVQILVHFSPLLFLSTKKSYQLTQWTIKRNSLSIHLSFGIWPIQHSILKLKTAELEWRLQFRQWSPKHYDRKLHFQRSIQRLAIANHQFLRNVKISLYQYLHNSCKQNLAKRIEIKNIFLRALWEVLTAM